MATVAGLPVSLPSYDPRGGRVTWWADARLVQTLLSHWAEAHLVPIARLLFSHFKMTLNMITCTSVLKIYLFIGSKWSIWFYSMEVWTIGSRFRHYSDIHIFCHISRPQSGCWIFMGWPAVQMYHVYHRETQNQETQLSTLSRNFSFSAHHKIKPETELSQLRVSGWRLDESAVLCWSDISAYTYAGLEKYSD